MSGLKTTDVTLLSQELGRGRGCSRQESPYTARRAFPWPFPHHSMSPKFSVFSPLRRRFASGYHVLAVGLTDRSERGLKVAETDELNGPSGHVHRRSPGDTSPQRRGSRDTSPAHNGKGGYGLVLPGREPQRAPLSTGHHCPCSVPHPSGRHQVISRGMGEGAARLQIDPDQPRGLADVGFPGPSESRSPLFSSSG